MAKGKQQGTPRPTERTGRAKLTPGESLKRLQQFAKRKEPSVVAVRRRHHLTGPSEPEA